MEGIPFNEVLPELQSAHSLSWTFFYYRKSTSLSPATRWGLINTICQAVKVLSSILGEEQDARDFVEEEGAEAGAAAAISKTFVVSQQFRDAFACHLYMLKAVMFFMESEAKIGHGLKNGGGRRAADSNNHEAEEVVSMRATCAEAMLVAAKSMGKNRNKLWKRGVPDETVVVLPCRIAYQMLESATGILARKASSADIAMGVIAATVDSCDALMGTVLAALMDMLHSYEHMASICAELCCMVSTNRLGVELLREVGRLDTGGPVGGDGGKASGIKYVALFLPELAQRRPRLLLSNIAHLLPHLDSEPYSLRSAIVVALGHIVEHIGKSGQPSEGGEGELQDASEDGASSLNLEKSRGNLLDILAARSHDTSSYTRSAVLKTWISLTHAGAVPIARIHAVTDMAIDRLHDKTVMVRKQALQVCFCIIRWTLCVFCLDSPLTISFKTAFDYLVGKQSLHGGS
jgi:condensin complex subunit 1